jgi:hypothetical protein
MVKLSNSRKNINWISIQQDWIGMGLGFVIGVAESATGNTKVSSNVDKLAKGLSNSQKAFKSASQGVKYLSQYMKHYTASIDLMILKATTDIVRAILWTTVQGFQFALDSEVQKKIVGD